MMLRIVKRIIPITLDSPARIEKVLQQFDEIDGMYCWHDVPMIDEPIGKCARTWQKENRP